MIVVTLDMQKTPGEARKEDVNDESELWGLSTRGVGGEYFLRLH
jgi:hypothetical protein